jgi:hypothetical protein
MKVAHHGFVDGVQIVRVENNSIKLKREVRKPSEIVSPTLVPSPWKIRLAAASVTQMLQWWDGCHQVKKMLAGIAQEMVFSLSPHTEALCYVHEMRGFGFHFFTALEH